jgi:hypothetical protein
MQTAAPASAIKKLSVLYWSAGAVVGSSQKYWQWARDCERWARDAEKPEDRDTLEAMAKAWANIAQADDDVSNDSDQ